MKEELRRIAVALRKNPYFSSGWNINFLQAFIRDGGACVYCGRDVMNEFCVACGDHLLPKQIYPDLRQMVDNIVPACTHCNRIKSSFDPSEGKGNQTVLTAETRKMLIQKSKEEILRRKSQYSQDYKTGAGAFEEAVTKYRQLSLS